MKHIFLLCNCCLAMATITLNCLLLESAFKDFLFIAFKVWASFFEHLALMYFHFTGELLVSGSTKGT